MSKREKKQQWDVPSHSNPNKTYEVILYSDGNYACSCPNWIYRQNECKNIKQIKEFPKKNEES